jgi:nucleoside-diphosphate-sugar epimerase
MKCLVTGAAGFIGSHLCERLIEAGHAVVGVRRSASADPREKRVVLSHQKSGHFYCVMTCLGFFLERGRISWIIPGPLV